MRNISIVIDSSIKLNPRDLPKNILDEIFNKLTVPNPQKKIAEREMLWDAKNVPSHLKLWKYNRHNELILPRGFLSDLKNILGDRVDYHYNTTYYPLYLHDVDEICLRSYQSIAAHRLYREENGIYSAPTGSGKSRVMLEVARLCKQKTIIFCEKKDIAQQWKNYARELGFGPCAYIGDNEWSDNTSLVIALRQSVWSRRDKLDNDWFAQYGTLIWDESHHCSAETVFELIQRFPAHYRFGCSATPDSDPDLFPIARAVIGPVVAETDIEEIGDHLVIPSVKIVKTEFEFPYRPTVRAGNKVIRNNYNDMMELLEKDEYRNIIITGLALQEALEGHTCIILSKRKKHLEYMCKKIQSCINAFCEEWELKGIKPSEVILNVLTGDNSFEFNNILKDIESYECGSILFSTLAGEGTDIPKLDRLFLAYPGRKVRGFEQAIGRIMRPHPQKKDAIIYDFRDYKVPILNSQYRYRTQNIYNKKEYKVETL